MPFNLQLATTTRDITTLDSPKLQLTLSHDDDKTLMVPKPSRDGGALTILFRDAAGDPVRRVSSLLRQQLFNSGRVDETLVLEPLGPGGSLTWTVNLAKYMWPLAAGEYTATASLACPGETNAVLSKPLTLRVQAANLTSLDDDRDNPILDRLDLLLTAQTGGGTRSWLRQFNPGRPLGAWYNEAIPTLPGATNLFCAAAAFRQTDSFEPTMRRWIVWQNGSQLQAALFSEGKPTGIGRRGQAPAGRQLLRQAFYNAANQLFVLFWNPSGRLECCELTESAVVPIAAFPLPMKDPSQLVVRCLDEVLHIAGPLEGLTYWTASLKGKILSSTLVHASKLPLRYASLQPEFGRLTAIFSEADEPPMIEMVHLDPRYAPKPFVSRRELPIAGPFPELAMDADRNGRFHLLMTTAGRQLYYCGPNLEPLLLASGEERYFPRVLCPGQVYLGFYEQEAGYRFRQFSTSAAPPDFLEYRNL
jgi:hypothetical protein